MKFKALRGASLLPVAGLAALGMGPLAANAQQNGDLTIIKPASLPKPYATASANNGAKVVPRPAGAELKVPAGFTAEVFADDFANVRNVAVAPCGDIFTVESGPGRISVLRDSKGTGKPDVREVFAEGLRQAFGLTFHKGGLYVATASTIYRFDYKDGQLKASGEPKAIVSDLPTKGHWTRSILFHPKTNKMYVTLGSEADFGPHVPGRAVIMEYNEDGTGGHIFAEGLRNAVGIDFQPGTNALWTAVNERDGLGDDLPPDYVTSVKEGGHYGWPTYFSGSILDPRAKEDPDVKKRLVTPDVLVTAHAAALGIVFYTGKMFPKEYQGSAFVAFHGSGNRTKRTGYDVVQIPFKGTKCSGGFKEFVGGWMLGGEDGKEVWGRPVGLAVAKDGALLIADDGGNKIWRVSYKKP
jgi:glucose/arabinose dehydrogenase